MKPVFVDSGFYIAILNPRDALHSIAGSVARSLGGRKFVTSELVLVEVLNGLSPRGGPLRRIGARFVADLRSAPDVEIVPLSAGLFESAFALYNSRADKTWSMTDCSSFQIMRETSMEEALAHDVHFAQAGFRPLLRPDFAPRQ